MSEPWTAYFTSADGIKGCKPTQVPSTDTGAPPYEQVRAAMRALRVRAEVAPSPEALTETMYVLRRYEIERIDGGHRIVWYREVIS